MQERVAVLYGGRSHERPGSLISGAAVIEALRRRHYDVVPIDPKDSNLSVALEGIDRVFIALHGWYGEDGKLQGYLETTGYPYTGSGVLASALGMNKVALKNLLLAAEIPTPRFEVFEPKVSNLQAWCKRVLNQFGFPVVVKPWSGGGSLGVVIARSYNESISAAEVALEEFGNVFIEEYIDGDFLSVGLLGSYGHPRALEVLRVTTTDGFYDYEAKHSTGRATYEVPAVLPSGARDQAMKISDRVYQILGCHGPLRVDMMFAPTVGLQVLEVNTVPGLSRQSNLARIAAAAGISYDDLIEEILASCNCKPRYLP